MSTPRAPEVDDRASRALGLVSPLGSAILLVLAPKCPLCVAAYLASIGVGAGAAACLAPLLRPGLAVLAIAGVLAWLWHGRRRAAQAPGCSCVDRCKCARRAARRRRRAREPRLRAKATSAPPSCPRASKLGRSRSFDDDLGRRGSQRIA